MRGDALLFTRINSLFNFIFNSSGTTGKKITQATPLLLPPVLPSVLPCSVAIGVAMHWIPRAKRAKIIIEEFDI